MTDFNAETPLIMATFKTVHGFNLNRGARLTIVDEPEAAGQVTEATARRLFASKVAVPADNFRPTPVETPEQNAARVLADATDQSDGATVDLGNLEIPEDLSVWQEDDREAGARKGDRGTNDHLRLIAGREGAAIESDDNKADLQRKIIEGRASRAPDSGQAPDTEVIG